MIEEVRKNVFTYSIKWNRGGCGTWGPRRMPRAPPAGNCVATLKLKKCIHN